MGPVEHGYVYRCEINDYRWLVQPSLCVFVCVCVCVCEQETDRECIPPCVRACEHTCVAACFFHEKAPDFQSVPGSLLAC